MDDLFDTRLGIHLLFAFPYCSLVLSISWRARHSHIITHTAWSFPVLILTGDFTFPFPSLLYGSCTLFLFISGFLVEMRLLNFRV